MAETPTTASVAPVPPGTDYFSYGELNPWARPRIRRKYDPNTVNYIRLTQEAALKNRQANVFEEQERFKAIVLYAYVSEASSTGVWALQPPGSAKSIVHVKARIPELHCFPPPGKLPTANDPGDEEADWDTISMYPTFVAKDDIVNAYGLPSPGQEIWVTYENLIFQEGPIFLGPVQGSFKEVLVSTTPGTPGGTPSIPGTPGTRPGTPGGPTTPPAAALPPGQLPKFLVPGSFIVLGDSQAAGKFGDAIVKRLKTYGLTFPPEYTKRHTARGSSQISHFLSHKTFPKDRRFKIYSYESNHMKGMKVLESLAKKPNNVIIILGANSTYYEWGRDTPSESNKKGAKALVELIKQKAGQSVNIVWISPSKKFNCVQNKKARKKMGETPCSKQAGMKCTKRECIQKNAAGKCIKRKTVAIKGPCAPLPALNKARRMSGVAVQEAVGGEIKAIIHAQDAFSEQTLADTNDGVHLNPAGALKLVNKIFPPVKREGAT